MFLFILKILVFLAVASVNGKYVQNDEELPDLKWPKKYTFDATKSSLTSGLVEDIKYWRTSSKSRVDYNEGAVKSISIKGKLKSDYVFGVNYKIHPETTEEYENELFCTKKNGTIKEIVVPEDILPTASDFEHVGKDYQEVGQVEKFVFEEENSKKFLWAYLKNNSWVPVRIEEFGYNGWLENLKVHSVWDIINFKKEVEDNVFDVDEYDCTEEEITKVTDHKDLLDYDPENKEHVEHAFNRFKKLYNRRYNSDREHKMRKNIFRDNMRLVKEHNSKKSSYKITINKFSDLTLEEKRKRTGLRRRPAGQSGTHPFPYDKKKIAELSDDLPSNHDLRLFGFVSPVRDQEDCGSCWTFGTTSAVEGAVARSNGGRLLRLANQALVDCAWGYGSAGCNGGSDTAAYHWLMNYGLPTEEEYGPYKNKDGFCNIENMTTTYQIKGFTDVTPFSIEALKIAIINHGPLSVSIDVGTTDGLYSYNGGIYSDPGCNPASLDHEVTLVGYGEVDGDSYWIVKNSWGRDWGIDGYFHITTRDNSCGITTEPTYAVI